MFRHPRTLVLAATFLILAPFWGRPLFVDDHAHFQEARDLSTHWSSPYNTDGRLGWAPGGGPSEANPPFYFYLVALLVRLLGADTWKVQMALWPLHAAGALAFFSLARRWTRRPLWATMAWILTPHHWLTANALLVDSLLAPVGLLGLAAWVKGWEEKKTPWLLAGGVLLGLAPLVKYTGVLFWAAAALWTALLGGERRTPRWGFLAPPLFFLGGWALWSRSLYGHAHAAAVAATSLAAPTWAALKTLGLFLIGTAPAALLAPFSRRDRTALFLACWLGLGLGGLWVARAWVCGRYLVVIGPAAVLLAARAEVLEKRSFRGSLLALLAAWGALMAWTDRSQARVDARAAATLNAWAADNLPAGTRAYYPEALLSGLGYYLDADRWTPLAPRETVAGNDFLVVPLRGLPRAFWPSTGNPEEVLRLEYAADTPLRVQDPPTGAGYYGSVWGPRPFSFSRDPLEVYVLARASPTRHSR